ncbi:hypothetical protein ACU4GD_08300 [Cupriavidus basilensis]
MSEWRGGCSRPGTTAACRVSCVARSTTPSGTPLSDSIDWIERFIRLFGSPNTCCAAEICNWHKDYAHAFTFGCGMPTADYRNANPHRACGAITRPTPGLAQARRCAGRAAGAKLLVVDPRKRRWPARRISRLRVRPGTDAVLAMAIANLLIEANGSISPLVRQWTNGPLLVRNDNGRFKLRGRDARRWRGLPGSGCLGTVRPGRSSALAGRDFNAGSRCGDLRKVGNANRPGPPPSPAGPPSTCTQGTAPAIRRTSAAALLPGWRRRRLRHAASLLGAAVERVAYPRVVRRRPA